jgi:hypothetical protein
MFNEGMEGLSGGLYPFFCPPFFCQTKGSTPSLTEKLGTEKWEDPIGRIVPFFRPGTGRIEH